jgi:hypothetical protein
VANPPKISEAGRFIGTANNVRGRGLPWRATLKRYDEVLADLRNRKGDVDEFDLLTDPMAATRVQSFPLGFVTQDSTISSTNRQADVIAGLLVANLVLGTASFPRAARDAQKEIVDFILAGSPFHTRDDTAGTPGQQP